MKQELVSFILINWNNEKYIEKCLNSIAKLQGFSKEVVVVDDFSDDHSIDAIVTQPDKIILLDQRGGIANARQVGLKNTKGEYVVYIDSDIEIESFDYKEMKEKFKNEKLLGIIGRYYSPSSKKYNWNDVLDIRRENIQLKGNYDFDFNLKRYTTFSGGFAIYKRDRLENLSGEGIIGLASEDLLQQIQFSSKGYHFHYMPSFKGKHHHFRSFNGLLKKCFSEAKGELWLMNKLMGNNLKPPVFYPVYTYPGLLVLSIVLLNPILFLINYFPFIFLLFYRHKINYFYLFLYQVLKDLEKVYWSIVGLVSGKLNPILIFKFIFVGTFFAILGMIDWMFRFFSKERYTIS